jgi:hypothetical protein
MPKYAVYLCESCRDGSGDDCCDSCSMEWADELSTVGSDYWPSCKCCGQPAQLVAPLVAA